MELLDTYNKYREKTGKTHERSKPVYEEEYNLVVHVWIINDKGEFLIQKRQPWKKGWPNMWDCAAAGAAAVNDDSKAAAIRETKEELGIELDIEKGEVLFTVKFSRGFDDIWLVKQNIDLKHLKLQYEEVAEARWVKAEDIADMMQKGQFINYSYFQILLDMINSKVSLKKTTKKDAKELIELQKQVFQPLYDKYQEHETTPVNQTMERFLRRFDIGNYYKIFYDNILVGSVFVYKITPYIMRFHIINILKEYENRGIAQIVMKRLELMYPEVQLWELDTIISEKKNCYLYEKMGYKPSGKLQVINDKLTLISYVKENIERGSVK